MEIPAETAPFFRVTKDINKHESKGSPMIMGQYNASSWRADTAGTAVARYVKAWAPTVGLFVYSNSSGSRHSLDGRAFAFSTQLPFPTAIGRKVS